MKIRPCCKIKINIKSVIVSVQQQWCRYDTNKTKSTGSTEKESLVENS